MLVHTRFHSDTKIRQVSQSPLTGSYKMNVSSNRMSCIGFVCAALGFSLSSHAATGPLARACESRLNYVEADAADCIRADAPWDFMLAVAQTARDDDAPATVGERQQINKFREDRDQAFDNKRARPGPELRLGGPWAAAEEDFANRAYPGTDIPLTATRNAQAAYRQVQGRGGDDDQPNQWTLIGPSGLNFPNVLTFSGANYIDSGRITALVLSPNCSEDQCSLYVGAAGGGNLAHE